MKNIFISSTCYDLMDIRAELYVLLEEMGFNPILSDHNTSKFIVDSGSDSIETCLINVRKSDYFIIILDQRYGPSLKETGYEDLSATHYEYKEAKKHKIPIKFYVRDKFESDYAIHSRNKKAKLNWIKNENDKRLFEIFKEHKKLVKGKDNNFYKSFNTSIDLKETIKNDFSYEANKIEFKKLIQNDLLPYLSVTATPDTNTKGMIIIRYKFSCEKQTIYDVNTSEFSIKCYKKTIPSQKRNILTPKSSIQFHISFIKRLNIDEEKEYTISYRNSSGFLIKDIYKIDLKWDNNLGVLGHSEFLINREYYPNDVKKIHEIIEQ